MFVNWLGDGITTANTITGNRLFCPPDNLGLVLGNYTDILELVKQVLALQADIMKMMEENRALSPNFFSLVAPNKGAKPFISRQLMVKRLSSTRALCTHVTNYISLVVL